MELDEEGYSTVRSNIPRTEPIPTLNWVYSMVMQQERMRTVSCTKEEKKQSNELCHASRESKFKGEAKDKNVVWPNCKCEGHDAESCFQLIGYSE